MTQKLFLFGTGKISRGYTEILQQLSIEIDGYIDNDTDKWGTYFEGRKVYSPDILDQIYDFEIIIACKAEDSICSQLSQINMQNRIITINHVLRRKIESFEVEENGLKPSHKRNYENKMIIMDNLDGVWGGAEDWVHKIASSLSQRGYQVIVIENTDSQIEESLKAFTVQFDKKDKDIHKVYVGLAKWLLEQKPFILFNIWSSELLWAASYVKKRYPERVKIISGILNDRSSIYKSQCEWDDYIDLYLCISSRIKNNLINLYGINQKKVFYKAPFIEELRAVRRTYSLRHDIALQIGYPCRLTCIQKRTDLLPELIKYLEKLRVNYQINIAGSGPYEEELRKYVIANSLNSKVKYYGRLTREQLLDFLSRQDIYLNISEFEGTSLTMLEAMACGCVPVVTNVSGVGDFIRNMENGFISNVGDIEHIAEYIVSLDNNRESLSVYGKKCRDKVLRKCKLSDYIDCIEKLINYDEIAGD